MTDADGCLENDIVSIFITKSVATRRRQRLRSQHRIMIIVVSHAQSRMGFSLTLSRATFRNGIQHRRCTKRALATHI